MQLTLFDDVEDYRIQDLRTFLKNKVFQNRYRITLKEVFCISERFKVSGKEVYNEYMATIRSYISFMEEAYDSEIYNDEDMSFYCKILEEENR
jgi:hypothetical protein